MSAVYEGNLAVVSAVRDDFAAHLTDAALKLAARHGVRGASVDQELDIWRALSQEMGKSPKVSRDCATPACQENFAARLTDAVYVAILKRGFDGSFLDVRVDLWNTLRNAVVHAC
jgi:hypothetical protein